MGGSPSVDIIGTASIVVKREAAQSGIGVLWRGAKGVKNIDVVSRYEQVP